MSSPTGISPTNPDGVDPRFYIVEEEEESDLLGWYGVVDAEAGDDGGVIAYGNTLITASVIAHALSRSPRYLDEIRAWNEAGRPTTDEHSETITAQVSEAQVSEADLLHRAADTLTKAAPAHDVPEFWRGQGSPRPTAPPTTDAPNPLRTVRVTAVHGDHIMVMFTPPFDLCPGEIRVDRSDLPEDVNDLLGLTFPFPYLHVRVIEDVASGLPTLTDWSFTRALPKAPEWS